MTSRKLLKFRKESETIFKEIDRLNKEIQDGLEKQQQTLFLIGKANRGIGELL